MKNSFNEKSFVWKNNEAKIIENREKSCQLVFIRRENDKSFHGVREYEGLINFLMRQV